MNDGLETLIVQEVAAVGYEVVELKRGGSRSRPTIDVRIDRLDGAAITVDDCARVSRALEQALETSQAVAERYVLEVSSPGVERPLRHIADWRRFVGSRAKVLSPVLHGRADVEIVAVEGEPGAEVVLVRGERGDEHRLTLADVKEARLAFHW